MELTNCEAQLKSLPANEELSVDVIPRLDALQELVRQAKADSEDR